MLSINVKINYLWAFPSQHKQPLHCGGFLTAVSTQIAFLSCRGGGYQRKGQQLWPMIHRFNLPHPTCKHPEGKSLHGSSQSCLLGSRASGVSSPSSAIREEERKPREQQKAKSSRRRTVSGFITPQLCIQVENSSSGGQRTAKPL